MTDNDYAIAYGECFEWSADGMQIFPIPATKGGCHGKHFLASIGYNFGCVVASDMLFDSGGGFSGSS